MEPLKKIAVSVVSDDGASALVDVHFGRAPFFVVVNVESPDTAEIISNEIARSVQGAGSRTASLLISRGVTDVVSGQYGPKAAEVLEKQAVRMWMAPSGLTAEVIVDALGKGELNRFQMRVYK